MDYLNALEQAIEYMEAHLDEEFTVMDVAKAVGYSYYHLTRQFSAVLGESVGSYIKKRRLAEGAKKLLYTKRRVIDIAMESGFDSSEAFSRAFKAAYKTSPAAYRRNQRDLFLSAKERLDATLLRHRVQNITVHPRIMELPDIKAAGLRGETTLRDNVLPELWKNFSQLAPMVPNQPPHSRGFGICEACREDNNIYSMNDDVLFSEVAAVEVTSFDGLPEPFVPKLLKGGRFAVFTHKGSLRMLKKTFGYIWSTWLLNSKEMLDDREDFEVYDERFLGYDHPESQIDLCIPLR